MKKLTISILLGCLSCSLFAQSSIDLLTVSGRYGVQTNYKENYPGTVRETGILINLKAPVVINEQLIWYNELTYTNFAVNSEASFPAEIISTIYLDAFIVQTGVVKRFSESTALQLLLAPRFMTDFKDVNSRNWQFGGIGLFEKKYSDKLMMRFGLLYNTELFGPIFTPIVHLDWSISKRWSIVGMWPVFGKINYHISENTTTGISHFGLTTTYRLGDTNYKNDYIERNSIDLSLFLRQRIAGNFFIEGRFGHTLNRKYAQYEEDQKIDFRIIIWSIGDDRQQKNINFENGLIANLRLVYNLPIE